MCVIYCLYLRCVKMVAVGTSDEEGTPVCVEVLSGRHGFHSTELFHEVSLALINNALVLCFLGLFSCVVC